MLKREPMAQPEVVENPVVLEIGGLVEYYKDGWRIGYLDEINKKTAYVIPMAAKGGKKPHRILISLEDVKAVSK